MNFERQKRKILGWLALFAPLPLPLNDVLEWPVLFAYFGLVVYYLHRIDRGDRVALPNWLLNVLGLVYLPILAFDLQASLARDQVVRALLHLILFLVVVKLFSIRREKEKWHVLIAIFFLFVAAMATSSHLSILFYLLAALAAGLVTLAHFAHLHVLASVGRGQEEAPTYPPVRRAPLLASLAIVLVAIPIFASMPRLRQPFVMGRGAGNVGLARTTGFSDSVDLSLTTSIRGNRGVALRIQPSQPVENPGSIRFKGATYESYRDARWLRDPYSLREIFPSPDRGFELAAGVPSTDSAVVFLEPLDATSLVVPTNTVSVRLSSARRLGIDTGGALYLPGNPRRQTLRFEVELGPSTVIAAQDPRPPLELFDPRGEIEPAPSATLDPTGATPRIAELAAQVMGEGPDAERIDRLLRHLLEEYAYTLDFTGRDAEVPLEEFLFDYKSGHCEYFASAMVLMLRSQGIPARFVAGFLGAERNPIEGYLVVRQQNAHAWVEAWTQDRGWQVYDPTPPEGRPTPATQDLRLLLQQMYDWAAFRWDRYILTYGEEDQRSFFRRLRERVSAAWARLWSQDEDAAPETATPQAPSLGGAGDPAFDPQESFWSSPKVRLGGLGLLALLTAAGVVFYRRRLLRPEDAYERLRRRLPGYGVDVDDSVAPLQLARRVTEFHPPVEEDVGRLVSLYLESSYAGRPVDPDRRRGLRPALSAVLDGVRGEDRRRRVEERRSRRRRPSERRRSA
ncbi:MAG: DUF3488 and transglutaminase-like domain-containing protein [Acidobacteriota bacterium]